MQETTVLWLVLLSAVRKMHSSLSKTLIRILPAQAIERTGVDISYGRLLDVSNPSPNSLPDNPSYNVLNAQNGRHWYGTRGSILTLCDLRRK